MKSNNWAIAFLGTALVGCETAHEIGRAISAPVRYVFNEPRTAPATNPSDLTNPGQPVAVTSPSATPRVASRNSNRSSASAKPRVATNKLSGKQSPPPQKSASAAQFPVAKPVPGKPGLVFNPFNTSGGYIDGYALGSKVKDPDSQKIFIVPSAMEQ